MFGHDDKPKEDGQQGDDSFAGTHHDTVVAPAADANEWQHPGTPLADDASSDRSESFIAGRDTPAAGHPAPTDNALGSSDDTSAATDTPASTDSNDLIDIKQDALGKLSPLIGHLDQSPDEKFRTLMMMIQASDDQSLIRQAYDTALEISDEKIRAQALLDIVNEINYFTQNPKAVDQ